MKKIFFATTILILGATVTFAHDTSKSKLGKEENREIRKEHRKARRAENRNEVGIVTINQFAMDFPHAKNVQYQKDKEFDVVYFTNDDNEQMKAYYDFMGQLEGTSQAKTFSDLPENGQKRILKEYPGYTIEHVIRYDDNEANEINAILYGIAFDADNYFVELKAMDKSIVVKVDDAGYVSPFADIK
jgi:hypothetical protein